MFDQMNLQLRLKLLVIFSCCALLLVAFFGLYGMQASHESAVALANSAQTDSAQKLKTLQETYDERFYWISGLMLVVLCILATASYLTTSNISHVADLARDALKRLASGDFTVRIDYRGGVLQRIVTDINATSERLQSVFIELHQTGKKLAVAAAQLSKITETTERDIQKQQDETSQMVAAMHEMSSASNAIANNAAQAAEAASNADKQAVEGAQVVSQAIGVIQEMAQEMEGSTASIHRLQQESTNIGAVLNAIKEIADQTNLLALNAAIEAARAGEQGRGFAVVADEVRTLAGRTQQATIEIQGMIEKLQAGSKEAVAAIEHSSAHVRKGVEQATQASAALGTITQVVNSITDMNTQIASAAEQQSAVVAEMNSNIESINVISQKNADGALHTSGSSNELAALAAQLDQTFNRFKV